jgi:hypothetical protein
VKPSKNGGDHHREGDGHHSRSIRHTVVGQGGPEQARDGHRHDPPGGDPADEQLLGERRSRAGRRDQHDQRPDHEQEEAHEGHRPQVDRADRLHVERCGEQEKQSRDEQDCDRLLEPSHLGEAGDPGVGQADAHHRDRQEPRLLEHEVGDRVGRDHRRQQHRRLEILGHVAAGERPFDRGTGREAATDGGGQADRQGGRQAAGGVGAVDHEEGLEGDHGKQGTDRIVDDRLPPQQRGRAGRQVGLPQERHHDGRTGDDEDRPEHRRRRPGKPGHKMGG